LDEIDDLRIEPEQLIDAGEQVVVSMRISGRGKLSGAHVELTLTSVSLLRDGNIVRGRNYSEKAEALEAVGLRK
jgi:ketosteroid isomerase-like protein